jgi:hypothetical protein
MWGARGVRSQREESSGDVVVARGVSMFGVAFLRSRDGYLLVDDSFCGRIWVDVGGEALMFSRLLV